MKQCHFCGQQIPDDANTCQYCGREVDALGIQTENTVMLTGSRGNYNQQFTYNNQGFNRQQVNQPASLNSNVARRPVKKKKNDNYGLKLVVISLISFFAAAGIVYFLLTYFNDPARQNFPDTTSGQIADSSDLSLDDAVSESANLVISYNQEYISTEVNRLQLRSRELTENDLKDLNIKELDLLRGYILATHGYRFAEQEMIDFFSGYGWYHPIRNDVNQLLTPVESKNISTIEKVQASKNETKQAVNNDNNQ